MFFKNKTQIENAYNLVIFVNNGERLSKPMDTFDEAIQILKDLKQAIEDGDKMFAISSSMIRCDAIVWAKVETC
jgi:hypothetical protein